MVRFELGTSRIVSKIDTTTPLSRLTTPLQPLPFIYDKYSFLLHFFINGVGNTGQKIIQYIPKMRYRNNDNQHNTTHSFSYRTDQ